MVNEIVAPQLGFGQDLKDKFWIIRKVYLVFLDILEKICLKFIYDVGRFLVAEICFSIDSLFSS